MFPDSNDIEHRLSQYSSTRGLQLEHRLGFGKDGTVFSTSRRSAVKVCERYEPFARELSCYQRLLEMGVREVLGHNVPQLIDWDESLWVIEMSIVPQPFIVDFASAYLDFPPDYSDEVWEHWREENRDKFGSDWPQVEAILEVMKDRYGVFLLDVHPANITFVRREE